MKSPQVIFPMQLGTEVFNSFKTLYDYCLTCTETQGIHLYDEMKKKGINLADVLQYPKDYNIYNPIMFVNGSEVLPLNYCSFNKVNLS